MRLALDRRSCEPGRRGYLPRRPGSFRTFAPSHLRTLSHMPLIDAHAHLADERILPGVEEVVERARAAGLAGVVSIPTHAGDAPTRLGPAGRFAHGRAPPGGPPPPAGPP